MNVIMHDDNIYEYPEILINPELIIDLVEKMDVKLTDTTSIPKWQKWFSSGDNPIEYGFQKRINEFIDNNETDQEMLYLNNTLRNAILKAGIHYAESHNKEIGTLTPLSISKYSTGKYMGPHTDSGPEDNDPHRGIPTVSVVLYLNDNYTGGELFFREQNIKIKPKAGTIVIFPSVEPYYHESLELTDGTKYMAPGFWRIRNRMV